MKNIFDDNSLSIGRTPLVRLNSLTTSSKAVIYGKVEGRNPSYSVKDRIGAAMIWEAEKSGKLKAGMEIVEPTSGNTGIALAAVAAARGYKLTLTMPESMSMERRKVLQAFGVNLVLTEAAKGMGGAIRKAEEIASTDPEHFFMPQQFDNPANPAIHESTTGPEIWQDTDGKIDILISGVGTGGTITGCSRFLKQKKKITAVAVEPENSPVIAQAKAGKELTPGPHKIQGIGAGFIPNILDLDLIDKVEQVPSDEAFEMARKLTSAEGIFCGISSGAAAVVALRLAALEENAGKTIVAILPDAGERYLSTDLYK